MPQFTIKHEGEEQVYSTGMRRNTDKGKVNYRLIHLPFLTRIASHLTKGAEIHGKNNWKLASTQEELERFEESAFRHLVQYLNGERDEDHAAAVVFNLMCAEYVRGRISNRKEPEQDEQASSIR